MRIRAQQQGEKSALVSMDSQKQLEQDNSGLDKANPVVPYLELLSTMDEASLKEGLPSMGNTADTPKLFRCNGKVNFG